MRVVVAPDKFEGSLRAAGRTTTDPWKAEGDMDLLADVAATLSSVS